MSITPYLLRARGWWVSDGDAEDGRRLYRERAFSCSACGEMMGRRRIPAVVMASRARSMIPTRSGRQHRVRPVWRTRGAASARRSCRHVAGERAMWSSTRMSTPALRCLPSARWRSCLPVFSQETAPPCRPLVGVTDGASRCSSASADAVHRPTA